MTTRVAALQGTLCRLRPPRQLIATMAHGATIRPGISLVKEIVYATGLGIATASVWKARVCFSCMLRARLSAACARCLRVRLDAYSCCLARANQP